MSQLRLNSAAEAYVQQTWLSVQDCLLIAVDINPTAPLRDAQHTYLTASSPYIVHDNRFPAAEGRHDIPIVFVGDFSLDMPTYQNAAFLRFMYDRFD